MAETYIQIPKLEYNEGTAFTATAYFRDGEASSASSTAKYRVDCLTTGEVLTDWTTLTPAVSIAISITSTNNAIQENSNKYEKKQITVSANHGLATQYRVKKTWNVKNNTAV